ncbi:MAG TPA: hypothetical protein VNL17_02550 [Verrucomicrobiae bacterium]|nr:hypothetical protein [Verrucomicrobiae bacterium]
MCYKFVRLLWWSLLISALAVVVLKTSAFAGAFSQGSAGNQQFALRDKLAFDGLSGLSYSFSGQGGRCLAYPLAYVDPGSGQLIWQMVAAACVGGLFYIKRVRDFLGRLVKKWFKKH